MRVDLFDFDLPEERIALRPALPRESARLLYVPEEGSLGDKLVGDLPDLLRPDDVLVFNDTRVIPARLNGLRRRDGLPEGQGVAEIEATLHLRLDGGRWKAFVRPAKRVAVGDVIRFEGAGQMILSGTVQERGEGGEVTLGFDRSGPDLDAAIAEVGHLPLPPYIASKRGEDEQDRTDYQTIYARHDGAVAAPTAGLHFTPELMESLRAAGTQFEYVTLHVGAGTFLPVKADDTSAHRMHHEFGSIDIATAERLASAKAEGRRVVAVGTTSLRVLESAAQGGVISPFHATTDIFITPGYAFRAVDALLTNFHLPRSTLFMLVSAFSGLDRMRDAYRHAIETGYRFYSYGDACLLERSEALS